MAQPTVRVGYIETAAVALIYTWYELPSKLLSLEHLYFFAILSQTRPKITYFSFPFLT